MNILAQVLFLISPHILLATAGDKIEFKCRSNMANDINYSKKDKSNFQSLEYLFPTGNYIIGKLDLGIEVTGGNCFDLIVNGRQIKDQYKKIVNLNSSPTPRNIQPDFAGLHLCQDIATVKNQKYNFKL